MSGCLAGVDTSAEGASAPPSSVADDGEREIVFAFQKNARECVRASLSSYRGETYLDLRVFFEGDSGRWLPTKKGLTLALDCLGDLERAVRALRDAVHARGAA